MVLARKKKRRSPVPVISREATAVSQQASAAGIDTDSSLYSTILYRPGQRQPYPRWSRGTGTLTPYPRRPCDPPCWDLLCRRDRYSALSLAKSAWMSSTSLIPCTSLSGQSYRVPAHGKKLGRASSIQPVARLQAQTGDQRSGLHVDEKQRSNYIPGQGLFLRPVRRTLYTCLESLCAQLWRGRNIHQSRRAAYMTGRQLSYTLCGATLFSLPCCAQCDSQRPSGRSILVSTPVMARSLPRTGLAQPRGGVSTKYLLPTWILSASDRV
ncbi:hypothetical protein ACQKWADRAFT_232657 [Trichoderma austrokoningii]